MIPKSTRHPFFYIFPLSFSLLVEEPASYLVSVVVCPNTRPVTRAEEDFFVRIGTGKGKEGS